MQTRLIVGMLLALLVLAGGGLWAMDRLHATGQKALEAALIGGQISTWQGIGDRGEADLAAQAQALLDRATVQQALSVGRRAEIAFAVAAGLGGRTTQTEVMTADGDAVFTTRPGSRPLLDRFTLRDIARRGPVSGVWPVRDHGLMVVWAGPVQTGPGETLILTLWRDATEDMGLLSRRVNGPAFFVDLRGRLAVQAAGERSKGALDLEGDTALVARAGAVAATLPLRHPSVHYDGNRLWVATPLSAVGEAGQAGVLLTARADAAAGESGRLGGRSGWQAVWQHGGLFLAVGLLGLSGGIVVFVRTTLRPVREAILLLRQTTPGPDRGRETETQSLMTAVQSARQTATLIDEVRVQASRRQQRQERLIRAEIRSLADSLDRQGREEMLRLLTHEPPADGPVEELGLLAAVLGQLSSRMKQQHLRLNELVADLREALVTRTRLAGLEQELSIARDVQLALVPEVLPVDADWHCAGRMVPAKEVGGDFFDLFPLDQHRFALMLGDVSGKGIPAALFMAISRTLLRATARYEPDPAACVASVNDLLAAENAQMLFVTLFYGVYDRRSGRLEYVNAGHPPPVLIRSGAEPEFMPVTGDMALAVLDGQTYQTSFLTIAPGDSLLIYSDGVTEATDPEQTLYGEDRLLAFCAARRTARSETLPETLITALLADLDRFADGSEQADDITLLALHRPLS